MLNNKELDFKMKTTKIYNADLNGKWVKLLDYNNAYISKGAILNIPNFYSEESCTELMFFDPMIDDCSLGLVIINGGKAGTVFVNLPLEAYYKDTRLIDTKWIINHYNIWIAPDNKIENVQILYQAICSHNDES